MLEQSKKEVTRRLFQDMQTQIVNALHEIDLSAAIRNDPWRRKNSDNSDGGGGLSRIISNGKVFEQGGVNFSEVYGPVTADLARAMQVTQDGDFYATGTSIVMHPLSPCVPTIHFNLRLMALGDQGWFGGGVDLTPYTMNEDAFRHFHQTIKSACDRHSADYYPHFKKWCDRYFYLAHRGEARGIGGIFFDHLKWNESEPFEKLFNFVTDMSKVFNEAYLFIVKECVDLPYTEAQKNFQLLRRGRYVEFNLLYDRGTKFGLESNGRTESILMSLPPLARWEYDYLPPSGSEEAQLQEIFRSPREWLD